MNYAEQYLRSLPRIENINEANKYDGDVFLLPFDVEFSILDNSLVKTSGLGSKWDMRNLDLIRSIKQINSTEFNFEFTNILTPLAYAESLKVKPMHITTQSVLFTKISSVGLDWIKSENEKNIYAKHKYDKFWLPFSMPLDAVNPGDIICIFNRRVNGWDGSLERPVIELLGAGGHLPVVWDNTKGIFEPLSIKENLQKEVEEELNLKVSETDIIIFGSFPNPITFELVILCGIKIDEKLLPKIQRYAYQNIDDDTKGIYMGTFAEVINFYRQNPAPFAGGKKSAPFNFPNNKTLMDRTIEYMNKFYSK